MSRIVFSHNIYSNVGHLGGYWGPSGVFGMSNSTRGEKFVLKQDAYYILRDTYFGSQPIRLRLSYNIQLLKYKELCLIFFP
jgi:hypothetical protein